MSKQGLAAIVTTRGNPHCHVILRGGARGPNYGVEHVEGLAAALQAVALPPRVMIDCSHANSGKRPERQAQVALEVAAQIGAGNDAVLGVMLESFLEEGRQDIRPGNSLVYGKSITDPCMSWKNTEPLLEALAASARRRRARAARRSHATPSEVIQLDVNA